MNWFGETLYPSYSQQIEIKNVLYRDQTNFQDLIIFENPLFGRVLALDGIVQTTEADEFIYHEMLGHVPLFAHGSAEDVLIIGGGDGGLLREVLRHPEVKRVVMVEIDRTVIDLCREYIPSISAGAFDDPRAEIVIADGLDYVATTDTSFDVILVDSTDPIGPGEALFTEAFYADCRRRLVQGGIIATQNGVPFLQPAELTQTYRRLKPLFADVSFFLAAVPTYAGGTMALSWATDDPALRRQSVEAIAARVETAGIDTRYYNPAIHVGSFAVPSFVADLMTD